MNDFATIIPAALRMHLVAVLVIGLGVSLLLGPATNGAMWLAGIAAGGAFGAMNLKALAWLGERVMAGDPKAKARAAVLLGMKMGMACAIVAAMLLILRLPPIAVLVGVSTAPLSLLVTSFVRNLAPRQQI